MIGENGAPDTDRGCCLRPTRDLIYALLILVHPWGASTPDENLISFCACRHGNDQFFSFLCFLCFRDYANIKLILWTTLVYIENCNYRTVLK
jgi:hypothetical protein